MRITRFVAIGCLSGMLMTLGCVTHTERVPPHRATWAKDESVWKELKREFGWDSSPPDGEPFYTRAARGVKESVAGWLKDDEGPESLSLRQQWEEDARRAEREQQAAIRRLRDLQAQEEDEAVRRLEEQRNR